MENIGLKDRFGVEIYNGCTVECLVGKYKGDKFLCVWNIPNHRYGFQFVRSKPIENPSRESSEHFYATPISAQKLKVL